MSPIINPNLNDMVDMTPLEPGTYKAKITACDAQKSKETNTQMIVPTCQVQLPDGKTRDRQVFIVTEGKGAFNFYTFLKAVHMDDLAEQYKDPNQPNPQFDTDTLIGQELQVVVDHQEYKGQTRDAITGYLPA